MQREHGDLSRLTRAYGKTATMGSDLASVKFRDPRSRVQNLTDAVPRVERGGRQSPGPKTEERRRKALNWEQGSGLHPRQEQTRVTRCPLRGRERWCQEGGGALGPTREQN